MDSLAPKKSSEVRVQLWKNQLILDLLVTGHDTKNRLSNSAAPAAAAASTIGVNGGRGLGLGPGLSEDGRDGEERCEGIH